MYVDVTLVSEDLREVPAHKIVLSSGSKVENILNPVKIFAICKHIVRCCAES